MDASRLINIHTTLITDVRLANDTRKRACKLINENDNLSDDVYKTLIDTKQNLERIIDRYTTAYERTSKALENMFSNDADVMKLVSDVFRISGFDYLIRVEFGRDKETNEWIADNAVCTVADRDGDVYEAFILLSMFIKRFSGASLDMLVLNKSNIIFDGFVSLTEAFKTNVYSSRLVEDFDTIRARITRSEREYSANPQGDENIHVCELRSYMSPSAALFEAINAVSEIEEGIDE